MSREKRRPAPSEETVAHSQTAYDDLDSIIRFLQRNKGNGEEIVREMHMRFPDPTSVLRAGRYAWEDLGLHPSDALLMSRMADIVRYIRRDSFGKHPNISRLPEASQFMIASSYGLQVERFYLICLNKRGCLKDMIMLQEGTSDCALFDLRRMLAETVRIDPAAIIISHNHPGGTLRPSQEDIDCTREALKCLTALNIPMLDHLIIASESAVSLRENGFIPESVWMRQAPENRFLKNWLEPRTKPLKPPKRPKGKSNF